MSKHDYLSCNKLSRVGPLASFCVQSLALGALPRCASSILLIQLPEKAVRVASRVHVRLSLHPLLCSCYVVCKQSFCFFKSTFIFWKPSQEIPLPKLFMFRVGILVPRSKIRILMTPAGVLSVLAVVGETCGPLMTWNTVVICVFESQDGHAAELLSLTLWHPLFSEKCFPVSYFNGSIKHMAFLLKKKKILKVSSARLNP